MKRTNTSGCAVSRLLKMCVVQAALLGVTLSASANGTIVWNGAQNISGDTDVSTNGTLVGAFVAGPVGVSPVTVNGVTFAGLPITGNVVTSGNFQLAGSGLFSQTGTYAAGPFALSASYQTFLNSLAADFGLPFTLAVSNLTPGAMYEFQWWSNHNTGGSSDTSATAGNSVELVSSGAEWHPAQFSYGQYATGTFVADATGTETITFSTRYYSQVNGFQLRQVASVPDTGSTIALLVLGSLALLLARQRVRRTQMDVA